MRCPKCHYLSFEPESRCRNCGYDFALAATPTSAELSIKPADAVDAPLADLELREPPISGPRPVTTGALSLNMDWQPADAAPPAPRQVPARAPTTTTELPLFVRGLPPPELPVQAAKFDGPLALVPPAPRPPLSVRRRAAEPMPAAPPAAPISATPTATTPVGAARKSSPFSGVVSAKPGGAEHGRLLDVPHRDAVWAPLPAEDHERLVAQARRIASRDRAGAQERIAAALVDAVLLAGIDAGIVWFTLRICALTIGQAATLPFLPLATFCILVDVGYLLMFTATSGQTVGKMAAGIRVVDVSPDASPAGYVTIRQAAVRALMTLPSLLTAGAGFLPALIGRGPAVHDRIAHTRVVRS